MADDRSPGWYTAPDGNGQQWWNGVSWSDARRGGVTGAAPVLAQPIVPQQRDARPDPYATPNTHTLVQTGPVAAPNPNRYATPALVLGLLSVFLLNILAPVGLVFSALALREAGRLRLRGSAATGLAQAGIGLAASIIALVLLIVQTVIFIAALASAFTVDVSAAIPGFGLLSMLFGR
jgi:hypothetical protein